MNNLPRITPPESGNISAEKNDPYYVVLPCEVQDFQKFVSGLLGKPQELRGDIQGKFKITNVEIVNIYHLLEQRMKNQNDAALIHFSISVHYDDGHSVVHNNIAEFKNYHPLSKTHPVGLIINATYLIKFKNHEIPEKQEIEITIGANGNFSEFNNTRRWYSGGYLEYKIIHTERTWATDIAGLIKSYASGIITKRSKLFKFLYRNSEQIVLVFSQIVFLVAVFFWSKFGIEFFNETDLSKDGINKISNFIFKSVFSLSFLFSSSMLIRYYVENNPFFIGYSSIVLTEEDLSVYSENERKKNNGIIKYVSIWIFSIFTGIISNIIYSKNWLW